MNVAGNGPPSSHPHFTRRHNMQALKHSKLLIAFMLISAVAGGASAQSNGGKSIHKASAVKKSKPIGMNSSNNRSIPVTQGIWGGQSVSFTVEKDLVRIEFDCAEGVIPSQLQADNHGSFRAEGTLTRHAPGPIRKDAQPQAMPALYEGTVKGKVMTLKVTLLKTNESAGVFEIEKGRTPRLTRCY